MRRETEEQISEEPSSPCEQVYHDAHSAQSADMEAHPPSGRRRKPVPMSAIAVAAVALGGMLWVGKEPPSSNQFASQSARSQTIAESGVLKDPTVSGSSALSVVAPDFSSLGFHFRASHPLTISKQDAIAFFYESAEGHRLDLYVMSGQHFASTDTSAVLADGAVSLVIWHDSHRSYLMAGTAGQDKLLSLFDIVNDTWTGRQEATAKNVPSGNFIQVRRLAGEPSAR